MPELEYKLATGINQDTLFNVKMDTKERMRALYEGFNVPNYQPPPPFIPKSINTDTLVKGNVAVPTVSEALESKDPNVVDAALNHIRQKAAANPMSRGVGFDTMVKYQEGQNKFTEDHWWKEDNQTMYGFNPYKSVAENEDFLHKQIWDNYSIGGKAWRGVGTFAGRTLSKLVTGLVGMVGDLGSMTWNGLQEVGDLMNINDGTKNNFWNDVSNNWLARQMEHADNYVKESILPTYKALDYDDKGAWAKLFDPYTWQTSFADGAGFLLQFAVPGAMFGRAAQGGKLARSIGVLEEAVVAAEATGDAAKIAKAAMTLERAKNVSKLTYAMGAEIPNTTRTGKIAGGTAEFLTGSKDVGGMSAHIFNTSMEAVAETKEGFNHTVQELMNNGMSREQAIEVASKNAPVQFWLNMGILTASNAFQNKLLQKALGNRGFQAGKRMDDGLAPVVPTSTTKVGKFFSENKLGNRIKFYGGIGVKSSIFEGYWEENAQTAAARYAKGEYERKGDDGGGHEKVRGSFIQQLIKQTIDATKGNDREAADSIMAGAVIGVLGGTTFAKISGERKQNIKDKADFVATISNLRDAWMSLDAFSPEIYDKDGKVIPEKAKEKAEQIAEKLDKIRSVFKRVITSEKLTNQQQKDMLQYQVFGDFVKAHIMSGTEEAFISTLKNWKQKTAEELEIYGVTPELQKDYQKWASLAEKLVDAWDNIKDTKYNAPKSETVGSYQNKTQAVKALIFDYTALKEMSNHLISTYKDLKDEINPFSRFPLQQPYNEKQAEIIALKQLLKQTNTPVEKERIEEKIKKLEGEQKIIKDNITANNDTKEDVNGFIFPKDIDPKKEFTEDFVKDMDNYLVYQWHQSDHENAVDTHQSLIDEYSNPETGLESYNKVVDYWAKLSEQKVQDEQDEKDEEEFNDTLESLEKELKDLDQQYKDATSEEEKQIIQDKIQETSNKIDALKEEFDQDEEEDTEEEEEIDEEEQFGTEQSTDSDASILVAVDTPFKTTSKETINEVDKAGNVNFTKEIVMEGSYDHDLTAFINKYAEESLTEPDKYEAFIIADTEELLKQRLSKKQWEAWEISRKELGAIVVLREKGKKEWLRFSPEERKDEAIIAFSYNIDAFEDKMDERIEGKMKRTGWEMQEVIEFFAQEQKMADDIRTLVLADPSLQVPVKISVGSLGLFPFTYPENAIERFKGHTNGTIHIVKDNNEFPGAESGQTVLEIPAKMGNKKNTSSGKPFYIPVFLGKPTLRDRTDENKKVIEENVINNDIYDAVQALTKAKFDTKAEADLIIQSFLKKIFYVSEFQYFKTIKEGNKFQIAFYYQNRKTGGETREDRFVNIPMKILSPLFEGLRGQKLPIYKKNQTTGKFEIVRTLSTEEYNHFVKQNAQTTRKVLTVKRGGNEQIYTEPVSAYFNISSTDPIEPPKKKGGKGKIATKPKAKQTKPLDEAPIDKGNKESTEDAITAAFGPKGKVLNSEIKDIEKRRKEELNEVVDTKSGTTKGQNVRLAKEINDRYDKERIAEINKRRAQEKLDREVNSMSETQGFILERRKEIDKKYDEEIANLNKKTEEAPKEEIPKAPGDINKLIERKEEELANAKAAVENGLKDDTKPAGVKKILVEKGQMTVARIQKELDDLMKLKEPEDGKEETPIQKLRKKAVFDDKTEETTASIIVKVNKKEYLINFETGMFTRPKTITAKDIEKVKEFFTNAHNYTFLELNINQKNVYLIKNNKLGKFVILDESFSPAKETKEMLKNKEYNDFKNCK